MNIDSQMALDILEIRKLLKTLVVVESYRAGLITLKEAYERSGIKSNGYKYNAVMNEKEEDPI